MTDTIPVLLVDDDEALFPLLSEYLTPHGFALRNVTNGTRIGAALEAPVAGLVLLDVMLPGQDGFAALVELRKTSDVPVIMLTARGDELDRIEGLERGADDYLAKPFHPKELLLRMQALLRRRGDRPAGTLKVGPLTLEASELRAAKNGVTIVLTAFEFRLLHALAQHAGKPVTRETLARELYGSGANYDPSVDRALDVHVSKLRQKIEDDPKEPALLRTVRGVGYLLARPS
jgi:DNA-binding response OmpR family regulator